ncbi:MAG: hypothetical protein ACYTGM_20830 [Planctomycetota bacterium]
MPEQEWRDPIVEEVRKVRQEYAARFNYDLKAIAEDLRRRQAESGRDIVAFPPRRLEDDQPEAPKEGAA